jgi:PEP-CTERM motif
MRKMLVLAALLASAPSLAAITANSGTVNAGSAVTIGTANDNDSDTDTAAGLPALLSATATSTLLDANAQATVTAFTSSIATWTSATQGTASMSWGWAALNSGSTSPTLVETNTASPNWEYSFSTGAGGGAFKGNWTLVASATVGSTFGLQGVYGTDDSPSNVTPFLLSPVDDTGSFNIALAPNTSYVFGFRNFGNLSDANGGLNSAASANFTLDWTISEGGAVPEPASWAMLITGFGLVGATARRRRAVTA